MSKKENEGIVDPSSVVAVISIIGSAMPIDVGPEAQFTRDCFNATNPKLSKAIAASSTKIKYHYRLLPQLYINTLEKLLKQVLDVTGDLGFNAEYHILFIQFNTLSDGNKQALCTVVKSKNKITPRLVLINQQLEPYANNSLINLKGKQMDFQEDNNQQNPIQPQPTAPMYYPEKKRKGSIRRIFWSIIFTLSIITNIILFMMLMGVGVLVLSGQSGTLIEEVIREGPAGTKIAIVSIDGTIYSEQAENVYRQLKAARKDEQVKAVIVKIDSPGGTISASDQIHQEILKFREQSKKPVIAFMQGTAASGGYYASVACEKIIAEPTIITGSIGVISSYFVLEELLENKLGVQPIIIKSGEKKDWPSSYRTPTEEEIDYIQDKLIKPALEIFINVVAKGRETSLSLAEVRNLADGSIFGAQEALENKLIDDIGYLDDAINSIKSIAGIDEAQVIRYRQPFSLGNLLGIRSAQNLLKINRNTLDELRTPQILYLWSAY